MSSVRGSGLVTDREHDEIELGVLERRLRDVQEPSRQTAPTEAGRRYRESLEREIERLRARLSSEDG